LRNPEVRRIADSVGAGSGDHWHEFSGAVAEQMKYARAANTPADPVKIATDLTKGGGGWFAPSPWRGSQIPEATRTTLAATLRKELGREPTDAEMSGRYATNLFIGSLPKATRDGITAAFAASHGGRAPTNQEFLDSYNRLIVSATAKRRSSER
jgi:hypothetical protein